MRKGLVLVTALVVLAALAAVGFAASHRTHATALSSSLTIAAGTPAAKTFKLETETTEAAQEQGLSGRSGLESGTGMLFTYNTSDQRCMWMKDMKFNIDIIWLDANGRIVSAVNNISPATYPHAYCATAQNVIELGAGVVRENGLRVGQVVSLKS